MPNFNSFTEACDFFGVDSALSLEAAMVAQYTEMRESAMDDMEAFGTTLYVPLYDLNDEIPY